jgi:hypothetical protein
VEAFIPPGGGLTESAIYTVAHRQGTAAIHINQAANNGAWVPLGIFEFGTDSPTNVQLSNRTEDDPKLLRWVGFDAIRWIFVDSCQPAETGSLSG